ncbi:hypothetical protein KIPB_013649, partial [Kipferlia bialata]
AMPEGVEKRERERSQGEETNSRPPKRRQESERVGEGEREREGDREISGIGEGTDVTASVVSVSVVSPEMTQERERERERDTAEEGRERAPCVWDPLTGAIKEETGEETEERPTERRQERERERETHEGSVTALTVDDTVGLVRATEESMSSPVPVNMEVSEVVQSITGRAVDHMAPTHPSQGGMTQVQCRGIVGEEREREAVGQMERERE